MTRPTGLVRVVSDLGSLLTPEDGLHRRVDVQHPWHAQQALPSGTQVHGLPAARFDLVELLEVAPDAILDLDIVHPQHRRGHCVQAQSIDMGIACVPTQKGQSQRAKNILVTWSIGAREPEGSLPAKIFPTPAGVKKLGKENQWPQRSHGSRIVPLDMITPAFGINRNQPRGGAWLAVFPEQNRGIFLHAQGKPYREANRIPLLLLQETSSPASVTQPPNLASCVLHCHAGCRWRPTAPSRTAY
jgi:hypothetical protein